MWINLYVIQQFHHSSQRKFTYSSQFLIIPNAIRSKLIYLVSSTTNSNWWSARHDRLMRVIFGTRRHAKPNKGRLLWSGGNTWSVTSYRCQRLTKPRGGQGVLTVTTRRGWYRLAEHGLVGPTVLTTRWKENHSGGAAMITVQQGEEEIQEGSVRTQARIRIDGKRTTAAR